jgi:hypothetical protein
MGYKKGAGHYCSIHDAMRTGEKTDAIFFVECLPDESSLLVALFDAELFDAFVRNGLSEDKGESQIVRRVMLGESDLSELEGVTAPNVEILGKLPQEEIDKLYSMIERMVAGELDIFEEARRKIHG